MSIKRVAIIGAGPTGLASAKYLLAENAFNTIDIFEQRDNVGGIWNLSRPTNSSHIPIPQTDPRYGIGDKDSILSLEFESPLYDYLETNIPKTLMAYSDKPFDEHLPLFPGHADVLKYLEDYAEHIKHLIQFNTQVTNVIPKSSSQSLGGYTWEVCTENVNDGETTHAEYDAVVVANGHYTIPHVPSISGLSEWHEKYPNTVIHSKAYRRPEDYSGQKILVIGNSASGLDIAAQIAACANHPVYLASRSASQLAPKAGGPTWRKDIAEVEEFLTDSHRAVRTKSGEVIEGLDVVIFATGYFYAFPFLSNRAETSTTSSNDHSPPHTPLSSDSGVSQQREALPMQLDGVAESLQRLTTSGLRTHDVYQHFLHIDHPTLAFPVLNLKIIPFPLAENQAAVLARLWSGRLKMPSRQEMRDWEENEHARLFAANRLRPAPGMADDSKYEGGFHTLVYPEDANQINSLYSWAASAQTQEGLANKGQGILGTQWKEYQVWLRGQFPDIKAAYGKHGDQRTQITDLSMLDGWKNAYWNWERDTPHDEKVSLLRQAAVPGW